MLFQITLLHSFDDLKRELFKPPDPKLPGSYRALVVKDLHIMDRVQIQPAGSGIPPEFKTWGVVILTLIVLGLLASMR